jgi:AraC-like DNA-binding protein/mannose-6-phosphate isomerase-like protein (cupin superfamily)
MIRHIKTRPSHPVLSLRHQSTPLGLVFMEPQDNLALHQHDYVEVVIITDGQGIHVLDDDAWPVGRGDIFVVPPHMSHGYDECDDLHLINLCIDAHWCQRNQLRSLPGFNAFIALEPLMRSQHGFTSHLHVDETALQRFDRHLDELKKEMQEQLAGFQQSIEHRLDLLLIDIARLHSGSSTQQHEALLQLEEVLRYIDQHYSENLSLDQLCGKAAMSASTLTRYFQRCFQCSPMHYLLQHRLEKARTLLRETDMRISAVAKAVGIPNANYFARVCKKYLGHSPQHLRNVQ